PPAPRTSNRAPSAEPSAPRAKSRSAESSSQSSLPSQGAEGREMARVAVPQAREQTQAIELSDRRSLIWINGTQPVACGRSAQSVADRVKSGRELEAKKQHGSVKISTAGTRAAVSCSVLLPTWRIYLLLLPVGAGGIGYARTGLLWADLVPVASCRLSRR